MNKKDKKLQKHLVDEMMKVYETNPDVMLYMQSLMENYEKLEQENKELNKKLKEITKRIRKSIDDDEDDLLYALFDIQDIIQDEEEQKRAFDKYIKPYIGDKENE